MEESIRNKTARTAFWGLIEKIAKMGITFIVTMLLARLLLPSDFGTIALLGVFFAISDSFVDCGFANALVRKKNCTQSDFSTAFFYNVSVAALFYLILFIAAPYIAEFYNLPILCKITRVASLNLVIGSLSVTQYIQLTKNLKFKELAIISTSSSFLSSIVAITCAYNGFGVWSLVIHRLLSNIISSTLLVSINRWKPSLQVTKESFKYLWGFGSKMLLTGLISSIYSNIYSIVIGKRYDSQTLGLYNRGQSTSLLVPEIISSVFTRNSLPILSQIQDDKQRLITVYRKMVVLVSYFNIPACLLLAALAEPFVNFFLTDKWIGAVIYIQLFCLSATTSSAGIINLNIFQVEGRSDITLKIEVIKKVIGFITVFALLPFGPLTLAIGSNIFNFFCYGINLYYANKLEGIKYTTQLMDLYPIVVASIVSSILVYMITFLHLNSLLKLLVGGALGLSIYVFITHVMFKMDITKQIHKFSRDLFSKYRNVKEPE